MFIDCDSNHALEGLTVVKVEPVEVHPFHQVSQSLRLKRGQPGVTDLPA